MDKNSLLQKLADNAPLALVLLGVIIFALGAAGGISTEHFQLPDIDAFGKGALMVLGVLIVGFGGALLWSARVSTTDVRRLKKDYGFRIEAPLAGQLVTSR